MASTPKRKAPARETGRAWAESKGLTRPLSVKGYFSAEEKADLDRVVQAWEQAARAQGFEGGGFAGWLRAMVRREAAALEAAQGTGKDGAR